MSWFDDAVSWVDGHSKRFQEFSDDILGFGKGKGVSSYSDFVNIANKYTDGWYSTVTGSLPVVGNLHNSVLNRDRTDDILRNTGGDWGDVLGYNSSGSISGSSSPLGTGITRKIEDGTHDLFEFYTGVKDNQRVGLPRLTKR